MTEIRTFFKPPRGPKKTTRKARVERPGNSEAHLAAVRRLPSCISGRSPCEAHHLRIKAERGVGMRSSDKWALPLTPDEHRQLHREVPNGETREALWFRNHGIDCYALALSLWANNHSLEAMIKVLEAHRGH